MQTTGKFTILAMTGLAVLALAGCGSKENGTAKDEPKSARELQSEAAALSKPKAGEYRQVMKITDVQIPGLDKATADQMQAMMKTSRENVFCLTQENADKGYQDMFKDVSKDGQCTYSNFTAAGGVLDATMECKAPLQPGQKEGPTGKMVMKLDGRLSDTGSEVVIVMDITGGQPPLGTMKMTTHVTNTRIGECKPA